VSELHKFIFDDLPVRGMIVRLTDAWTEVLQRRQSNRDTGAYPAPVQALLGEMLAAGTLMQSSIKFNGALILQILGDGPVKLAVAEVQADLSLRATATVVGTIESVATLSTMVNKNNQGKCAITLDPQDRFPGQQPYQGVVPLYGDQKQKLEELSEILSHYMLQSEQLDTTLVLAADDSVAAGLLIQRMPLEGAANMGAMGSGQMNEDEIGRNEHYNRIAILASSLKKSELLTLDVETILRRLFWEEKLTRFSKPEPARSPRFACSCNRERVSRMIVGLGQAEAQSIVDERGEIEVSCEFCGLQYRFDAVDSLQLFKVPVAAPPSSQKIQ
jgi:molecular chaperone Hsp33